jgi:2-(1,2-epoxy-1,2-dihydrophenyl)acetyl-CoA isomerase
MAGDGRVTIDRDGPVAILTLDRPERKNALAGAMRQELLSHLEVICADGAIGAIVIRGAGDAFCAGADLQALTTLFDDPNGAERFAAWLDVSAELILYLTSRVTQPTLAAIAGPAIGAGLGLALACDYRLAAESASFMTGFARIGFAPDWGATYFLPRRVGGARALDLSLRSPRLGAMEALAIGLVDEVAPADRHAERWRERARAWADVPEPARSAMVAALRHVDRDALARALGAERERQLECFCSPAARRRVAARLESMRKSHADPR